MHIPDGFLATPVWAALDVAAAPAVGYLARRAQRGLEPAKVPLLGVMGAFVFAAQMINFTVGLGTSGHLVGYFGLSVRDFHERSEGLLLWVSTCGRPE